jgi:pyruvate,orthophosphate dikinase
VAQQIFRFSAKLNDFTADLSTKAAKALLGGKGAGLVMMAKQGLNVPSGFTITTEVCNEYRKRQASGTLTQDWWSALMTGVMDGMGWLEGQFGYMPLVSVRSGAPVSMPGMMDTILNVGLTTSNYSEWEHRIGTRGAADSERRLVQMLGSTGYGVPMEVFDFQLAKIKKEVGEKSDTGLTAYALSKAALEMRKAFEANKGFPFPINDAYAQLETAIKAVFESWMNPRAIEYRKINKLDESMGTAVNVQAMVFGNMGEDSGSGVLFTRNPSTGEPAIMGEYLSNAQGEDVVAGIRTPVKLQDVPAMVKLPDGTVFTNAWRGELVDICGKLEQAYRDMVDLEFTVQKGQLFILQSRVGKRSARAAFKIAVDLVDEKMIDKKTAIGRLTPEQFKVARRPTIDPSFKKKPDLTGLPACPGVAAGRIVFSSEEAVKAKDAVILVTAETNPDDIAGMAKAVGILTQTGGATSHAAVVARAMDKPCVVGCTKLVLPAIQNVDWLTIDGSTGNVWFDVKVPVIDASEEPAIKTVMDWCMDVLGTCELSPVGLSMDRPHRIVAAQWWGSEMVLDAILTDLEELPSRAHIAFDMASPASFNTPADMPLVACFGKAASVPFSAAIAAALKARAAKLKGLAIVNLPPDTGLAGKLTKLGYVLDGNPVQAVPKAVPKDYAAFTVLSR